MHHGGAGTTKNVLFAGVPNIITPVFMDQHYWARCIRSSATGYGFDEQLKDISAEALGDKIKECMAPEVQEAAARLGRQLKAEKPGHDVAADVVSEVAKQRMLALDAANHPSVTDPRNYKQPRTPAALRRGQSLGMGADAIDDEEQDLLSAYF